MSIGYVSRLQIRFLIEGGADQDAARIALEYISQRTKHDGFLLLHREDFVRIYESNEVGVTCLQNKATHGLNFILPIHVGCWSKEAEQSAARAAILPLTENPDTHETIHTVITYKVRLHATWKQISSICPFMRLSRLLIYNYFLFRELASKEVCSLAVGIEGTYLLVYCMNPFVLLVN
ncbi:uncharacterized protein LOC111022951 isoform X2 [Momordica charantia]|uniref:Uncharacterized protein LOC111022951 isoform X2 n=1 Tax=Momordica charantia TaxID=3673 RepID=A0A6J1DTB1_MOMCH|nr:uncharacterized protein LOC111022951 isoform X2 [Momordica charantia]